MVAKLVASDLVEITDHGPRLVGGRRIADGRYLFPYPSGPERATCERVLLAPEGRLWSWTVQRIRPKSPPYAGRESEAEFQPFMVGYVELPGQVVVEGRIDADIGTIAIGDPMTVCLLPFAVDAAGETIETFGFRPAARSST